MSDIYIFKLASERSKWLTLRQEIIASNIANSDTPGYKAKDIQPFSAMLDQSNVKMKITSPLDIVDRAPSLSNSQLVNSNDSSEDLSGNSVNLEQELIKAGDVTRSYTLNTNVTRIFHQMILSALK